MELREEYRNYLEVVLNTKAVFRFSGMEEGIKRQKLKNELKAAIRECGSGSKSAAVYVKEHIREWLLNEKNAEGMLKNNQTAFINMCLNDSIKEFDVLLLINKDREGGAFEYLHNVWQKSFGDFKSINKVMLDRIFLGSRNLIGFKECLELLTQWIYEDFCGMGCIDMLFYERIDGLSCGVSGTGTTVWVFYKGRHIMLEFMMLKDERELERICRKIYKYGASGELSARKGYIISSMRDGSRVVVLRPPFSEKWAFFIRKFLTDKVISLSRLYPEVDVTIPERVIKCIIAAGQAVAITGEQGAGKTTLLKTLTGYIPDEYTIRTQEVNFELNLGRLYPEKNIVSVCETTGISGREGIDVQKKTDGLVMIVGEVVNAEVAGHMILAAQTTGKFTMFKHHARSTKALINTLRNDLIEAGVFSNEEFAKGQVRDVVRFDIHIAKDNKGRRYIERITEIVPDSEKLQNIIEFTDGRYHITGKISDTTLEVMKNNLSEEMSDILAQHIKECDTEIYV